MSGRKVFTAGEVLTASDLNNFVADQVVFVFAGSAARGSAIGTATEGMVSYLEDNNRIEVFTTFWQQVWPVTSSVRSITAAHTAVAGDANNVIYASGTAAVTVTVPDIFAIGDRIDIWRNDGGTVTIASGTGVTDWGGAGTAASGTAISLTFKIDQTYNAATVQKVAANTYRVVGKITA
jgi:hypothetical protein